MTPPSVPAPPPGYERVVVGDAVAVCLRALAPAVQRALAEHGTLLAHAAAHPARRELRGRAPVYAIPLGDAEVVVRHSWHGGTLAPLTRDLFLPPTRAPRELATSERLRALGVRTPELVAYAISPGPLGLVRADVATRLVAGGRDLATAICEIRPADRGVRPWVRATGALLHALAHAGARHPDLNLKNVLLVPRPDAPDVDEAWVLDLDVAQVDADPPDHARAWDVNERNLARLERSLRKWRDRHALPISELDFSALRTLARHGPDAEVEIVWRPGHNVGPT